MKRFAINSPSVVTQMFDAYGPFPHSPGFGLTIEVGVKAPPGSFTAGVCSRCGGACQSQMVRMPVNVPGKAEALCSVCVGREREARSPEWFAAEERATR